MQITRPIRRVQQVLEIRGYRRDLDHEETFPRQARGVGHSRSLFAARSTSVVAAGESVRTRSADGGGVAERSTGAGLSGACLELAGSLTTKPTPSRIIVATTSDAMSGRRRVRAPGEGAPAQDAESRSRLRPCVGGLRAIEGDGIRDPLQLAPAPGKEDDIEVTTDQGAHRVADQDLPRSGDRADAAAMLTALLTMPCSASYRLGTRALAAPCADPCRPSVRSAVPH